MKFVTVKHVLVALLALASAGAIQADRFIDDTMEDRGGCCFGRSYECSCNPLYCGAFDLQVQGGVDPILWRNRSDFFAVSCPVEVESLRFPIDDYVSMPKFSRIFKTPWTVGGQVGYAWSDNTRVYLEFDYVQASGKKNVTETAVTTDFGSMVFNLHKYRLYEFYAGARYYWHRWCDRVSIFLGGKIGLAHHRKIIFDFDIITDLPETFSFTDFTFAMSNTVVSGGGNIGLDFCICGNWSFVITAEVVASCGPHINNNIAPGDPSLFIRNLVAGGINSEVRFPVTAAVRYSF